MAFLSGNGVCVTPEDIFTYIFAITAPYALLATLPLVPIPRHVHIKKESDLLPQHSKSIPKRVH
jgi:hypothetical protein